MHLIVNSTFFDKLIQLYAKILMTLFASIMYYFQYPENVGSLTKWEARHSIKKIASSCDIEAFIRKTSVYPEY